TRGPDRHRELATPLQHDQAPRLNRIQATSTRGVRARIRRVAGCATPTGSAGHAGATANLKLIFHLDHSAGADQTWSHSSARGSCALPGTAPRQRLGRPPNEQVAAVTARTARGRAFLPGVAGQRRNDPARDQRRSGSLVRCSAAPRGRPLRTAVEQLVAKARSSLEPINAAIARVRAAASEITTAVRDRPRRDWRSTSILYVAAFSSIAMLGVFVICTSFVSS